MVDCEVDFIKMPAISRAWCRRPQPFGVGPAKLLCPIANGFVGQDNPAFGDDLLDVAIAKAEAKVQPYAGADNFGGESATVIQTRVSIGSCGIIGHHKVKLTMPFVGSRNRLCHGGAQLPSGPTGPDRPREPTFAAGCRRTGSRTCIGQAR